MQSFQQSKAAHERKLVLQMMSEVEKNPHVSQRKLALELGIAMGLVNTYLKRCINKGWIKVGQVPVRRFAYYLTPTGFAEKSRITTQYLSHSLQFFREARKQCEHMLDYCAQQGWKHIGLIGRGDLAEIASIVAAGKHIHTSLWSYEEVKEKPETDAVIITCIQKPQRSFNAMCNYFPKSHILAPDLLHISERINTGKA